MCSPNIINYTFFIYYQIITLPSTNTRHVSVNFPKKLHLDFPNVNLPCVSFDFTCRLLLCAAFAPHTPMAWNRVPAAPLSAWGHLQVGRSSGALSVVNLVKNSKLKHPGRLTAGTWEYTHYTPPWIRKNHLNQTIIIFRFQLLIFRGVTTSTKHDHFFRQGNASRRGALLNHAAGVGFWGWTWWLGGWCSPSPNG